MMIIMFTFIFQYNTHNFKGDRYEIYTLASAAAEEGEQGF